MQLLDLILIYLVTGEPETWRDVISPHLQKRIDFMVEKNFDATDIKFE